MPSKSPTSSPILCVLKQNKDIRLVCDYRYVNSFTVPDAHPMPNIDEVIDKIGHSNLITTWDARGAYWPLACITLRSLVDRHCNPFRFVGMDKNSIWQRRRKQIRIGMASLPFPLPSLSSPPLPPCLPFLFLSLIHI